MMYRGMSTEIPLPNLGLGIYATQSFLIGLQPVPQTLRSSSARLVNMPRAHYYGADTTPEDPAYTSYADWGQAESSRHAQEVHNLWEQPQPQYSDGSWQASSEQWHKRTNSYQWNARHSVDHQEASSSGHQQPSPRQQDNPSLVRDTMTSRWSAVIFVLG
jgi:hypothetical protein